MEKITDKIFEKINPTIETLGYEIVDVEYVKKGSDATLTVYIDKVPVGISLDDCEKVSVAIDPLLDELNPTNDEPYTFNVSSPGLDRPFKKQRDFERNYGKEVEIKLYAPMQGKKIYEGVLISRNETVTEIELDGKQVKIENSKIAIARPLVKFE
jgi:ribosome maturation factor RimP